MRPALACALALLAAATGPGAVTLGPPGSEGRTLDLGASLRTIPGAVQQDSSTPKTGFFDQSLLRLTLLGRAGDWLKVEAHAVESVTIAGDGPVALYTSGGKAAQRYRALDLQWRQADGRRLGAYLDWDRASVRVSLPYVDVTVGRQAVNHSKTLFWNPLDVFLPFDPRTFDRDYKPGIDAARVQLTLGDASGLEVVGALGPTLALDANAGAASAAGASAGFFDSTKTGAAVLARAFTTLAHVDLSLQAGKVYGGIHFGAGASGELFGFGIRAEATLLRADGSLKTELLPDGNGSLRQVRLVDDAASLAVGLDRRFESELLVAVEVFHNGAAAADDLLLSAARVATFGAQSLSRDLAAVTASYPLTPLWTLSGAALLSLSDGSVLLTPGLKWSASNEVEVLAGALLGVGKRPGVDPALGFPVPRSEYGTYPNLVYLEGKVYF